MKTEIYINRIILILSMGLISQMAEAQELTISPLFRIESWMVIPINQSGNQEQQIESDIFLRRLELGGHGSASERIKYEFSLYLNHLGSNENSPVGGTYKGVGLWKAFIDVKLSKQNELFHLHSGYFWALTSSEYILTPWNLGSLDKAYSNAFLRNFITGKSTGIETGIGLGGQHHQNGKGMMYRVAVHYPENYSSPGLFNPLYTYYATFRFGQPEQTKYSFMTGSALFNKKEGVSIGFGGSYQGETDNKLPGKDSVYFQTSFSFGLNLNAEWKNFNLDTEYYIMRRAAQKESYNGTEGHIRLAWRWILTDKKCLQPSLMYAFYNGTGSLYKSGIFKQVDIGINYYPLGKPLRLGIHYINQSGKLAASATDYIALQLRMVI